MFRATKVKEISPREVKNMELVRKLAPEGMVLLKNDGILPLDEISEVAAYGNGVEFTIKGGTGSGDVNSRYMVNVKKGFENAGIKVVNEEWLEAYERLNEEAYAAYIQNKKEQVANGAGFIEIILGEGYRNPDHEAILEETCDKYKVKTAIYVVARNSGEGADRRNEEGDLKLSKTEIESIKMLAKCYEQLVVVLNVGGAMCIDDIDKIEGVGAILLMSQPGNIAGDILADVLTGKSYPSGKLTTTWANNYEDYPFGDEYSINNDDLDDSYYKEGIYVGYRYFETAKKDVKYCFGYGISYANFDVETKTVNVDGTNIKFDVNVINKSDKYKGKEVVQVYVSKPGTRLPQPAKELVAFAKTGELAQGCEEAVEIEVEMKKLVSYDEACAGYILEDGLYNFYIGTSVRECELVAQIELDKAVVIKQVKNVMPKIKEFEELTFENSNEREENVFYAAISSELFETSSVVYNEFKIDNNVPDKKVTVDDVRAGRATVDELVMQLSAQEMSYMCVGIGWQMNGGGDSMIGAAAVDVPGAAGETTSLLEKNIKLPKLVLADGPAGLRLVSEFGTDKNGKLTGGGMAIPLIEEIFGKPEEEEPVEKYYQYCTAIPIATMLAQSWNMSLIEQLGDMVGEEMEEFGVHLWLAPGMNIHKNVLCGRNFEYYSEDPLLTGLCAAAMTNGVQKHRGCGTTIKHYALNNQEANRQYSNSNVCERAIRDIYLKGFEICVKLSKPKSIMTSYNLINGEHAATNKDLIKAVLRTEWDYKGLVMTDWGTTGFESLGESTGNHKYPNSVPSRCIHAGNDLIMPGFKHDLDNIVAAVEDNSYEMTIDDLRYCTKNIINTIISLT